MVHGSPAQPIEGADRSPNFKRFAPAGRVTLTHGASVFVDRLMWHRRSDSRLTVDGEAHGPAHGSPSAECARIVRGNEVQSTASHRRLRALGADGSARAPAGITRQGVATRDRRAMGASAAVPRRAVPTRATAQRVGTA